MLNNNQFREETSIYFDGACNPEGHLGWGFIVVKNNKIIHAGSGTRPPHPENSSNTAEYLALLDGIHCVIHNKLNRDPIVFIGDSQLVIRQMTDVYGISGGKYAQTAHAVKSYATKTLPNAKYKWISRKQNEEADQLSKLYKNSLDDESLISYLYSLKEKQCKRKSRSSSDASPDASQPSTH